MTKIYLRQNIVRNQGIAYNCWSNNMMQKLTAGYYNSIQNAVDNDKSENTPSTLGTRDFSCTVSGFSQVFIVTRARRRPLAEDESACGRHRSIPREIKPLVPRIHLELKNWKGQCTSGINPVSWRWLNNSGSWKAINWVNTAKYSVFGNIKTTTISVQWL